MLGVTWLLFGVSPDMSAFKLPYQFCKICGFIVDGLFFVAVMT